MILPKFEKWKWFHNSELMCDTLKDIYLLDFSVDNKNSF